MSVPVVLFFKGADGYGWSERFYATPQGGDFQVGEAEVLPLVNARAAMLTSSNTITHVRVGTATKRLVTLISLNGGQGVPGTEMPPSSPSEVAIIIEMQVPTTGYNRSFVRGIPERVTQLDGYVPDATFTAEMNAFLNILKGGGWNIQGTLGSPVTQYAISNLTPNSPRGFTFSSTAAPPVAVGNTIRVHGTKVPGYSGLKTVTKIEAGPPQTFTVGGAAPPVADTGAAPFITTTTRFDAPITVAIVVGLSRRAAGRPFGLSRGRRPTLYSLRQ